MFEVITKPEFDYPDTFNARDFIHVYEFQKYTIHEFIRHIMEVIEFELHNCQTEKVEMQKPGKHPNSMKKNTTHIKFQIVFFSI